MRPVKNTRIRKKAKGLGIVHCTGGGEADASGAAWFPLLARGLVGCCVVSLALGIETCSIPSKLEWNCGHRRHPQEQDAPARQQQKHKAKWAAQGTRPLPRQFSGEEDKEDPRPVWGPPLRAPGRPLDATRKPERSPSKQGGRELLEIWIVLHFALHLAATEVVSRLAHVHLRYKLHHSC